MRGSFFGRRTFRAGITLAALGSLAWGFARTSTCWVVAPISPAGDGGLEKTGLAVEGSDDSRPHFSGRGLQTASKIDNKEVDMLLHK